MGLKSTKKKKSASKKSFQILDDRKRKILGAVCWFAAIYMTIAFISYMYTWKVDQDKVFQFTWESFFQADLEVQNWLGRLGATLSNMFFYWGFGLPSIVIVFLLLRLGRDLIQNRKLKPFWELIRNTIPIMAFASLLLEFIFRNSEFTYGGAFGESTYYWLHSFVGNIGLFFLILFVGFSFIIWYFNPKIENIQLATAGLNINTGHFDRFFNAIQDRSTAINSSEKNDDSTDSLSSNDENNAGSDAKGLRPNSPLGTSISDEFQNKKNSDALELDNNALEFNIINNAKTKKKSKPVELEEMEIHFNESEPAPQTNLFNQPSEQSTDESASPTVSQKLHMEQDNENHIEPYDPTATLPRYKNPTLELLKDYSDQKIQIDRQELENNKDQIIQTLLNYKIEITKIRATVGPTVTLYEIIPAPGIKISKIKNLEDDIALSLAALGIRIIAPIPGKGTIGIEVPNKNKQIVSFKEVINSEKYLNAKMDLPIALGKTISNEIFVADLAKMPHLLIAGATGQGKSVGINTVLMSLLYKKHPSQMKLVLIDPKKVELFPYGSIAKHYLACLPGSDEPIVCETSKVIHTLNSLTIEMDQRYDLLKKARSRNLKEYNAKFVDRKLNPKDGHKFLPFLVLVIDEFADLIMTAGKEIELPIGRLAQLSRAVGIHLIIATQRPSVNIITGVIKANFPARLAFKVSSKVDSRTILDQGGADQLIGRGDMLLSEGNMTTRIQCAFVDTPEVEEILDFISDQQGYGEPFYLPEFEADDDGGNGKKRLTYADLDSKFVEAAKLIVSSQHGSTSSLQRALQLGYNRAGRIIDQMEALGIVGPAKGSKPRDVLFFSEIELDHFINQLRDGKV